MTHSLIPRQASMHFVALSIAEYKI